MRFATVILLLLCRSAAAHPQHPGGGPLGADLLHLLSEPDHLALLLAPVAIALAIAYRWKRQGGRRAHPRRTGRAPAASLAGDGGDGQREHHGTPGRDAG